MTSLRFVGDLPLWAGGLLALLASLAAWLYYRREMRNLPRFLRRLLPLLRAAAVLLLVLVLTGPVLHHREVVGRLGRVLLFLDASQSMSVTDNHMPVARKLLIAQRQGWLPMGNIDMSLWETANQLAEACTEMESQLHDEAVESTLLDKNRRDFARKMVAIAERLDRYEWDSLPPVGESSPTRDWSDIRQRFHTQVADAAQQVVGRSLTDADACRDCARQLLDLCQAVTLFQRQVQAAFEAYGSQLADTHSPPLASALTLFDETSRWRRAERSLLDPSMGVLVQLARQHEVELFALTGSEAEPLWSQAASVEPPAELRVKPAGRTTDLSGGIGGQLTTATGSSRAQHALSSADQRTAVVLLTDGRHNSGSSPIQLARVLGGQQIAVHTIGFGSRREPPDLALLEVEHPDLVFQKGRIRGTILVKDRMPPGQPFVVQISQDADVLWQQQLTTTDVPRRRIGFEFSVDELVDRLSRQVESGVHHHALPLSLRVSIAPLEGETETANNDLPLRFSAITQSYKLLIMDGRSRWETRYIRNVFQRDEQWDVNTVLVGPGTEQATLPRGGGDGSFPTSREELFEYDLIVFGEVPPAALAEQERTWIRDFVERRGGGIVFLDGRYGHLRQLDEETLRPLLPVSWLPGGPGTLPSRLQLTELGAHQAALKLEATDAANRSFWQQLPAPHQIVPVEALPGTETLVEAEVDDAALPAVVTRSFGAGRVLYFAFDETWRWRYKVADTYHQRFWNQVAKWVMPRPFAVSDEYVSLDSGPPSYASGESAEIRVQLRGTDGRPLSGATVDALLWRDGQIVSTIGLTDEGVGNGLYRGHSNPLTEGEYEVSVQAAGFGKRALRARTDFIVLPPHNEEMQRLACNDNLLREMAGASSGAFLREEQISQLVDVLKPLSSGHIVESDTLLWQSYWWFAAVLGLLSVEWMLRKRAGLL